MAGPKRMSLGIKNFDKLIEGGFEQNSINLLLGDSGCGKTIFATQFLMEGIKNGESCLFITFEEKRAEFFSNMLDFGWDLEKYEKSGKFTFLEYTPEKVKTMLDEGGGTIESVMIKKKVTRLVIDSITSFELLFDEELRKREAALELFNMLRKWGCTSLLTCEADPVAAQKTSSKAVEFESDAIIALYSVRSKKEREIYVEILKMRGTNHSRQVFPIHITKKGVEAGTKPYTGDISF